MKHSIKTIQDDQNNFFYCLYEHATDQALNFYYFEEDALARKKFLDSGGAFDGFTPSFMLIIPNTNKDTNKKFEEIL